MSIMQKLDELFEEIRPILSEKEFEVLTKLYIHNMSGKQISVDFKVTQTSISKIKTRAIEKILQQIENENESAEKIRSHTVC